MADGAAPVALTGAVGPADYFRFEERDELDWDVWSDVLRGRIAGAVFRGVLTSEVCDSVRRNFWNSPLLKGSAEGVSLNGNVCGALLVAHSSMSAYLDEVERNRPYIDALFAGPGRAVPALVDDYARHLAQQGVQLRVAEHQGRQAGVFKLRSRESEGGAYALAPHTDASAFRTMPHLSGFEIQRAVRYYSVIACLENDAGGELVIWNITPDQESIRALRSGLDPRYPEEALAGFARLTVPVRTGDFYLFDVGNIHAVGQRHAEKAVRCSVQWNMGVLDDTTILRWA
ncbi:2OG-Fe(II)-dependent halogenase WelO5 family protein [Streptomyces sp. NPDC002586]